MKSVFALFMDYEDCRNAVDELLQAGFDEEEMNAMVDEKHAKERMEVNLERLDVQATDAVGDRARGLDVLLGVEQPVVVPRLGSVYAAGEIGTMLAKAAKASGEGQVKEAMAEFGIPAARAEAYIQGIIDGGILFWVRTSDERAAEAAQIFRVHNGTRIMSHGGS